MQRESNTVEKDGRLLGYRAKVVTVLVVAIIVVRGPLYLARWYGSQGFTLACAILCCQVFMAGFPFLLAKALPAVAGFDCQLFPSVRRHWLYSLPMILLLIIASGLCGWLQVLFDTDSRLYHALSLPITTHVAPAMVMLGAVIALLFAPIAEELFWRAYLLSQLTKVTRWPVAISLHALLYSFATIPMHWSYIVAHLLYGVIFGSWWIRYRSLLPLILAHVVLNGIALGPYYAAQFGNARQSHAKHKRIDILSKMRSDRAVPALIALMADRDELVSLRALEVLGNKHYVEAEPYLADALAYRDDYLVHRVLFAIEHYHYSALNLQVREVAWSDEDLTVRLSAVSTLMSIGDETGLAHIAKQHPEEKVRRFATDCLKTLRRKTK